MPARILIIEDNVANMELMVYLLHAYGYTVEQAYNGPAGLTAVQATPPDLVVCDIHLPKMDGYEVLRQLRHHPAMKSVPVIAVTALAMVGDREKLMAAGFDGYIGKPIEPVAFVSQIASFLPVVPPASVPAFQPGESTHTDQPLAQRDATVLIVDDSPINRELLKTTLEPFGYRLLIGSSVQQGLEIAARETFDLILCDVHMPNENGFEFIQKVRAIPRLALIPFIFLTATSGRFGDAKKALELGASRFLHRPIEPHQLIAEFDRCLRTQATS